MNTAGNHLHMETEKKLRDALLCYMEQETEPTVARLCSRAGVNRSTFYRHYRDVYDLMTRVEMEFQHGLYRSLDGDSGVLSRLGAGPEALTPMIAYIGQNPHFYRVYLKKYAESSAQPGFRNYWEGRVVPLFRSCGVESGDHMRYYFEYVKSGLLSVLRAWLENGCRESPGEMALILDRVLPRRP